MRTRSRGIALPNTTEGRSYFLVDLIFMKKLTAIVLLTMSSLPGIAQSSILFSFDKDLSDNFGLGARYNYQMEKYGLNIYGGAMIDGYYNGELTSDTYIRYISGQDTNVRYLGTSGGDCYSLQLGPTFRLSGYHHLFTSFGVQVRQNYNQYDQIDAIWRTKRDLWKGVSGTVGYGFLSEAFTLALFYTQSYTPGTSFLSVGAGFTF